MKLRDYITCQKPDALSAYADRCGIAVSYLRVHVKYASKDPSVSLIKSLSRESEGYVSLAEVLDHFGITEGRIHGPNLEKRRPKGRPVPPNTHHHSAVGTR